MQYNIAHDVQNMIVQSRKHNIVHSFQNVNLDPEVNSKNRLLVT